MKHFFTFFGLVLLNSKNCHCSSGLKKALNRKIFCLSRPFPQNSTSKSWRKLRVFYETWAPPAQLKLDLLVPPERHHLCTYQVRADFGLQNMQSKTSLYQSCVWHFCYVTLVVGCWVYFLCVGQDLERPCVSQWVLHLWHRQMYMCNLHDALAWFKVSHCNSHVLNEDLSQALDLRHAHFYFWWVGMALDGIQAEAKVNMNHQTEWNLPSTCLPPPALGNLLAPG